MARSEEVVEEQEEVEVVYEDNDGGISLVRPGIYHVFLFTNVNYVLKKK